MLDAIVLYFIYSKVVGERSEAAGSSYFKLLLIIAVQLFVGFVIKENIEPLLAQKIITSIFGVLVMFLALRFAFYTDKAQTLKIMLYFIIYRIAITASVVLFFKSLYFLA